MKTLLPLPKSVFKRFLQLAITSLLAVTAAMVRADSTDGTTPLALKPGAPAGSYALSDLDHINPFNGSLNFRLPLLNIGGRGSAGYTMTLPLEQKWRINVTPIHLILYEDGGGPPLPDPQTSYLYFPSANWWTGIKPGYGPGVMQGRVAQLDAQVCPDTSMRATFTLTRLTFTGPDGTEFELHDKQSDGTPAGVGLCDTTGFNRGRIFATADGSAATFISDQNIVDYIFMPNAGNDVFNPSGFLLLRDGTRYRIDNGTVTWLRDRNGNKVTFVYDSFKRVTTITDSLNRQVTVTYSTTSIPYDEIVYKGFGGAQRTMRVNYAPLGDPGSLRAGYSLQTFYQLFPVVGSSMSGTYNPKIVRSVTLPNNQQYQFQYNSYGELARVVLPTGGAFEYDHDAAAGTDPGGVIGEAESMSVFRRVVTRRVYADGSTMANKTTFSQQQSAGGNTSYVLIDQFGSDGVTRINQRKVYHEGFALNSLILLPTDYSPWKEGRELQSDSIAADGTTVLQRVVNTWQQPVAGTSWPLGQAETNAAAKPNSAQVTQVVTTLEPAQSNKVSKQTFVFDRYTNRTDVYEYNFGTGTAGPLVRRTHTDFLTSSYDTVNPSESTPDMNQTAHIRSLPTQVSVFDAGGVERARSTTEYDNYTLDGANCSASFHCPLLARSNISGLDSNFSTSYTKRGNPTAATSYLLVNGSVTGSVSTYSHFDVAGNVLRVIDPRSTPSNIIASVLEYDDRFGAPNNEARANSAPVELAGSTSFAFATKVTNALGHTSYVQFDYQLGKPVNAEDANGVVASGYFNDSLDRPTQIRRAIGTAIENQTTFGYDDVNRIVTSSSDRDANNDNILVSKVLYDQLGRTIEGRQQEGGTNYIATQTQYDDLGRAFKTSNPFRPWQSESVVWTTQAFDALGRVISVTTPDNATVATSYSGNSVTVADQAGKQRKSVTDALGRLVQVYEAPNDPAFNYLTEYAYDVLDNLTTVTQGSQTRTFAYDSLKRLTNATNPESGTIGYQYDNGSNLLVKTDARNVSSHFEYDVLNRLTRRWYNGSSLLSATTHNSPALPAGVGVSNESKLFYDSQTLPAGAPSYARGSSIGRQVGHTYGTGSNGDYLAYDALGRSTLKIQQTGAINYQLSAVYNRIGAMTSMTYPSGHTIANSFDAAGRLTTFSGNLGDGTTRTYANEIIYSPFGSLGKEKLGTTTPVYNKLFYNVRGQLAEIRESTSYTGPTDTSWNRGAIINSYSDQCSGMCSGSDNNGNLKKQEVYIPHDDQVSSSTMRWQQYDYDVLNRLNWVREVSSGGAEQWKQQFTYDRWGNRTINTSVTYGIGINNKAFTVNTANNRLGVPGGQSGVMSYDPAGNLTNDTYTGSGNRIYDAENKITSAWGGNNQAQLYSYDAAGQRIKRTVDGVETWQVYGLSGELVAEYAASGAVANPQKEYGYRNGQLLVTAFPAPLTNFALGKTSTQSSTSNSAPASRAVDGSIDGVFANGSVTHTLNDVNAWWQLDLGQLQSISTIKIWNRAEFPERLTNFYIFVSDQPFTSTNLATTLNQAGVSNYYTSGQCGFPSQVAVNRTGRYIRVQLVGTNYLSIAELQALGTVAPSNVALNKAASQSSTSNSAPASRAVDGNADGIFANGSVTHTLSESNAWWHVDLGQVESIGAIKIWNRVEFPERLTNFYVFVSDQPFTSTNLATTQNQAGVSTYHTAGQGGFPTELTINRMGRYVRVQLGGTNYLSIAEVQVWTGSTTAPIQWLVSDHLGTPRMLIDQTGSLAYMKRHDYLPFGEELFAPVGGRTTAMGYASGDGIRQQFTAKERDVETGLDYFLARYYFSLQGRFTSPDEFTGGPDELYNFADDASDNPTFYAELANPQSLNKYQYTYNNPINLTDPDGHCPPCLAAAAAAAIVILLAPDTTQAPTGNETKPLPRSGDGIKKVVAGGMASGPAARTVVTLETARQAAASERKARQAETDKLARKVADEAQASGVTSGAGGATIARTGERFTALSGESQLHPLVQKIYDSVPQNLRKPFHSKCCEGKTTSQMINARVNPRGATHSVVRIRAPGDPLHGTPVPPCPSCAHLFKNIDRIFKND